MDYNYTGSDVDAWVTVLVMDVWHWTPLVALLCYAGLRAIPDAYYQAARIDGASRLAVFRYIQLPKMRGVLMIAVLLRFMDSFMIYTEPFVLTGGGPGNATTFLSQYLTQKAVGQFDLGPAAAFSIIYFLIILLLCFILSTGCSAPAPRAAWTRSAQMREQSTWWRAIFLALYLAFAILPLYWMLNMSFKTNTEIVSTLTLWPRFHLRALPHDLHRSGLVFRLHQLADLCADQHGDLAGVALPAAYAFSRYRFIGDKHVFFWLLTNRMTPPAVFLLPFFQLYSSFGLMDTHGRGAGAPGVQRAAGRVILEGFMSGVPREIDETAYVDGYSFPRFFLTIFLPLIKSGVGVAAFFCFMFSWVELLLARTLTSVNAKPIVATMTRTVSASGMDWGVLAAAGC